MKRSLRIFVVAIGVALFLLLAGAVYVQVGWEKTYDRSVPQLFAQRDSATVARGEYIFKYTWQCWNCHTAEASDANASPSGGRRFDLDAVTPGLGIYYSKNITPDSATGIGSWTDGEIIQAMREGLDRKRHMLFPLMPIDWLKGLSDDDALALVAYLRSIPPVHNPVPAREPHFLAKALMAFKVVTPAPAITASIVAPPRGATPEYGRYFSSHLASCAECHTPRNVQNGETYFDSLFAGGNILFGGPEGEPLASYGRNLRPNEEGGIGRWTEDQFLNAVTMGLRPDSTILDPHMPYAHFKFLTVDDLRSVYLFLKTLPPLPRSTPPPRYRSDVRNAQGPLRGRYLFQARCQPCHGVAGGGAHPTSVPLAEVSASLQESELMEFIRGGQTNLKMPPFANTLTDGELRDVIAYIRSMEKH